jgi:hypothetical protein
MAFYSLFDRAVGSKADQKKVWTFQPTICIVKINAPFVNADTYATDIHRILLRPGDLP